MSVEMDFDMRELLEEIPDNQAKGDLREDLSANSNYQVLRTARAQARNRERALQNDGESLSISSEDWDIILEKVPEVLKNESKDIEIVAWYIEALTRKEGFTGLAKGFALARQLIEKYAAELYPHPDEEGTITQLSSLAGLNGFGSDGALIYPIKAINITQGDVPGPLAVWQCEQVLEVDRISDPEKKESRYKSIGFDKAQFDTVLAETETSYWLEKQSEINAALQEYEQYQQVLDEYCEDDPLPTRQILDALKKSQQVLQYIAGDRLVEMEQVESQAEEDADMSTEKQNNQPNSGAIGDREDALRRLREVALFFRRTEPHSPISYSIEQAVRWSNLPLTELIKELIPDDAARVKFQNLSGIGISSKETN